MLHYGSIFIGIAVVGSLLGFTGIDAGAFEIAKILFFIFMALFVVLLTAGLARR